MTWPSLRLLWPHWPTSPNIILGVLVKLLQCLSEYTLTLSSVKEVKIYGNGWCGQFKAYTLIMTSTQNIYFTLISFWDLWCLIVWDVYLSNEISTNGKPDVDEVSLLLLTSVMFSDNLTHSINLKRRDMINTVILKKMCSSKYWQFSILTFLCPLFFTPQTILGSCVCTTGQICVHILKSNAIC